MQFSDIIGQKRIKSHLQAALRDGKVSHAYIFNGEKESGKLMMAQAFAQALMCENGTDETCGECATCKKIEHQSHPDFIYVTHEKPGTISVNEIRQQLVEDLEIRPYSSSRKVYIIEEAEKMTTEAQNALLKSIEEPPEYGLILLLTENASALLSTIRSRCITLTMAPVEEERAQVKSLLLNVYQMPDYEAEDILDFAQGNVGKAIALASNEEYRALMDDLLGLVGRIHGYSQLELRHLSAGLNEKVKKEGLDIREYFNLLVLWYRDVLLYKATLDGNRIYFRNHLREIKQQSRRASYASINDVLTGIEQARAQVRSNISLDFVMLMLFQKMRVC